MTLRIAVAVFFAVSFASAQTEVWTQVPPAKVQALLQEMGLDATEKAGEKSTLFVFPLAGFKVHLDSRPSFMELQLALSDKVTAAAMNDWNRTHRFTRAYMDTDGGATLESDLDYGGGVTKAAIVSFINGFRDVIPSFTKAVLGTPGTSGASTVLTLLDGHMSVQYDPTKWAPSPPSSEPGRFEFHLVRGDGFAVVIADSRNISTDSIADTAFANIRKQDPNARLVLKQKRRVGGVDVWFQTVQATIKGTPATYYGYYYGGQAGNVQLLTYTARSLIDTYAKDFLDFLNGFQVSF